MRWRKLSCTEILQFLYELNIAVTIMTFFFPFYAPWRKKLQKMKYQNRKEKKSVLMLTNNSGCCFNWSWEKLITLEHWFKVNKFYLEEVDKTNKQTNKHKTTCNPLCYSTSNTGWEKEIKPLMLYGTVEDSCLTWQMVTLCLWEDFKTFLNFNEWLLLAFLSGIEE